MATIALRDRAKNGSAVKGLRAGTCQPVSLQTNFSSIKVALPEGAGYTVHARTSACG